MDKPTRSNRIKISGSKVGHKSKRSRRSYDASFKIMVINEAEASNNFRAGKKYGVSANNVIRWRDQKERLLSANSKRKSFRGPRRGRFEEIDKRVVRFVVQKQNEGIPVSRAEILLKGREIAKELNIRESQFEASLGWCKRMIRRYGLTLRRRNRRLPVVLEASLPATRRRNSLSLLDTTLAAESESQCMVLSVKIERDLDPTQNMEVGANDPRDIKSEPQADTDIFNGAVVKSLTSSSPSSPVSVQIKMEAIDSACLTEKEHTDRQFCCRIEPQVPNTGSMASGHCLSSDPIKTEECDPDLRNTGQQTGSWLFCGTERQRSSTGDMSSPACRESHQVKTEPVYPPCTTTEEQMNLQGCEGAEMRTNVEKYQFTGSLISDHVKTDIDGVGVEAETAIQTFKREPCEHSENVEKFESQRVECNDCGSIFKCVTALIQHYSQIHKSETLHICILCGKSFTKASGLTWHRRTIHPPYRCTECGKSFEKNSALMKHHTIHRSKELHHCSQCGKRYTYASCLHRHLESHVE